MHGNKLDARKYEPAKMGYGTAAWARHRGAHHQEDGPQEHHRVEGHEGPHPGVCLPATALHCLALAVQALVAALPRGCTQTALFRRSSSAAMRQLVHCARSPRAVAAEAIHASPGLSAWCTGQQEAARGQCEGSARRRAEGTKQGQHSRRQMQPGTGSLYGSDSNERASSRAAGSRLGTSWPLVSARPEKPVMGSTRTAMVMLARIVKTTSPGFSLSPWADTPSRRAQRGMKSRLRPGAAHHAWLTRR